MRVPIHRLPHFFFSSERIVSWLLELFSWLAAFTCSMLREVELPNPLLLRFFVLAIEYSSCKWLWLGDHVMNNIPLITAPPGAPR
jgi:hypothetical protein